jgi:LysM repeat protein
MADNLDQLKQKYQSVFDVIQRDQVHLTHVHVQDGKLFIQGDASSEQVKNDVWNQIKQVNPNWQSDLIADIRVTGGGSTQGAAQSGPAATQQTHQRTYTVKPGDTLSKIAGELLGSSQQYMKIFEANRDKLSDPNKIQPGQELKIPS